MCASKSRQALSIACRRVTAVQLPRRTSVHAHTLTHLPLAKVFAPCSRIYHHILNVPHLLTAGQHNRAATYTSGQCITHTACLCTHCLPSTRRHRYHRQCSCTQVGQQRNKHCCMSRVGAAGTIGHCVCMLHCLADIRAAVVAVPAATHQSPCRSCG